MPSSQHLQAALVTTDFRIYHELAPYFEARGVSLHGYETDEEVPDHMEAVILGADARSVPLLSPAATLLACLDKMDPRGPARRCVFGVDPGVTIGLAVLCDGAPRMVGRAHSPEGALATLRDWATGITCPIRVHIGDGYTAPDLPDWPCFIVPEHNTSPPGPVTGSRHTDAAILIAMRQPKP